MSVVFSSSLGVSSVGLLLIDLEHSTYLRLPDFPLDLVILVVGLILFSGDKYRRRSLFELLGGVAGLLTSGDLVSCWMFL